MNSEFSFSKISCLTKAEEPSLPYYLPIAGGRIIGFIPFPTVLVQCEMQSVSSRIWTRVAVSMSYDDNHYTTILWWRYQEHRLPLVWSSLSCSTVFQFPRKVQVFILLFAFFQFYAVDSRDSKVHNFFNFFFCLLLLCLVALLKFCDPCVYQNARGVCASHSPEQIVGCAYTICLHDQVSVSCTIPNG